MKNDFSEKNKIKKNRFENIQFPYMKQQFFRKNKNKKLVWKYSVSIYEKRFFRKDKNKKIGLKIFSSIYEKTIFEKK